MKPILALFLLLWLVESPAAQPLPSSAAEEVGVAENVVNALHSHQENLRIVNIMFTIGT